MDQYISPLTVSGLHGRVLHLPAPTPDAPEVLFIYGHHSSIERWQGIMELFNQRFAVRLPDLPGFGGMDSLYKIGKPATLDNLADYLADFVRERYKNSPPITIVGMSLGFVVITRMLQRHPDLTLHVGKLVSLFGFASHNDFNLPLKRRRFLLRVARIFSKPILAGLYRALFLNRFVLSHTYHRTPNAREKFKGASAEQQKINMDFEIKLWQESDLRTYMKTSVEFLTLDNAQAKVNLPVYHIAVASDRYFNNASVEEHYRQIFTDFHLLAELQSGNHAPTRILNAKQAEEFIPSALLDAIAPTIS